MPDWSRRHALQAAGGVLCAVLAGCNGSDSASRSYPRASRNTVEDITVLKVRNTAPSPMVERGRDEMAETTDSTTAERPPDHRGRMMDHVTAMTRDGDRQLVFPDDVPGASDLRSFFEQTDFETESIYLAQSSLPECYDRHLTGVYREEDGVDAQFCRSIRPADVACSADSHDMVAFAIRLPFAGDDFNSVGGGHSSQCDGPYRHPIDPDTSLTVGDEGGDAE